MAKSYKPVFEVDGKWYDNAQRFKTRDEAMASASARFMVWTVPRAYDAHESDDEVNCVRVSGCDVMLEAGSVAPEETGR